MSARWASRGRGTTRSASAGLLVTLFASSPVAHAQRIELDARLASRSMDLGRSALPAAVGRGAGGLAQALAWRTARPGVQVAELDLRAGALGIPVHAIVVRCDPRLVSFALQLRTESNGMTGTWRIDSMPDDAVLGMNAGQFKETGPWGWLVLDGERRREALRAPLAASVGIDSAGRLRWIEPGRERVARGLRFGFQSFPRLLERGNVPRVLRDPALMDMAHRDARLMLAESADGLILFVLTRFGALGAVAERVPIGLTTPESVALVIALGARDAVMLDGGISGQLLVRDSTGGSTAWRGLRPVPLGLVALPAGHH